VRRLVSLVVLVVVAGCRTAPGGGPAAGATSGEAAVLQFLEGARAQDLQALSAVWGNAESPARDRFERQELERRLLIMMCHLRHDESSIGPAEMGEGGRTVFPVTLTQGAKEATSRFITVRNTSSGRWFVEDFDLRPLRDHCTTMPTRPVP
jgi:hypothetical protein